jgi:transcriptional regulator with XRE-family HTH domain
VYRSRKQSDSRLRFGNGREGSEGTSRWLAFDRRNFGEILSDWQEAVAPGDVQGFIRDHLHLDGALTPPQFVQLISAHAAPSNDLALYLSASVPHHITGPLALRNRAHSLIVAANTLPTVHPDKDAINKARADTLHDILSSPTRDASLAYAAWRDALLDRCQRLSPDRPIDGIITLSGLAKVLNVSPAVLLGKQRVSVDDATYVANEVAQVLGLEGDDFDSFADLTTNVLAATARSHVRNRPSIGRAARFLRECQGQTQEEFGRSLNVPAQRIALLELGLPVKGIIDRLADRLGLSHLERDLLLSQNPLEALDMTLFDQLTSHFSESGLTVAGYLSAVARDPQLLQQRCASKIIANVEAMVAHFATDGLTTSEYLRAALKNPALLYQKPATLTGNIEAVLDHFAADRLSRQSYLRAALKHPHIVSQRPTTIFHNVDGVVSHFASDGLTRDTFLKAALKHPHILSQKPSTVIGNIEGVVNHFTRDGLTTADYLRGAIKHPQLFAQKPSTIIHNVKSVVEHFANEGLATPAYLRAATKLPQLFLQRPSTIMSHIQLLKMMHEDQLLGIPGHPAAFVDFICSHPALMVLSDTSLELRRLATHIVGRKLITHTRGIVEKALTDHLTDPHPDDPDPALGAHARRVLLKALRSEGYIRGK